MTKDELITAVANLDKRRCKRSDVLPLIEAANRLQAQSQRKYEIPTVDQVVSYFEDKEDMIPKDIPLEAQKFHNHWEEQGWKKNGKRITSWKRIAATWNLQYQQYNEDRIKDYENGSDGSTIQTRGDRQVQQLRAFSEAIPTN